MKKLIAVVLVVLCLLPATAFAADETGQATPEDVTAVETQLDQMPVEIEMLAKLVYREARGVTSKAQQAAVIWVVLNRFDAGYRDSIAGVITQRGQFAWRKKTPVLPEFAALARDVVGRWLMEKQGVLEVGRTLPSTYLYFAGKRGCNRFRETYRGRAYWDWSLPSPYES